METFRYVVNDCIRIGLLTDVSILKRLSKLCYVPLAHYDVASYYKLHSISKAAGILANRKQSIKQGRRTTKNSCLKKSLLVSCYGFKIIGGILRVPLGGRQYFDINLNEHTQKILSDPAVTVRSFTLTANNNTLSICCCKEVKEIECSAIVGIDRNLWNLTIGHSQQVKRHDL